MMLWGSFSSKGPGKRVRVHGIIKHYEYKMLHLNLAASARKLKLGHHLMFQQDNDPKHMSKSTQK